jgi:hypothetical protein
VETTALAEFLLKGQAPPKKLRLENDLMGGIQDLEALFEPYEELALSSGGVNGMISLQQTARYSHTSCHARAKSFLYLLTTIMPLRHGVQYTLPHSPVLVSFMTLSMPR